MDIFGVVAKDANGVDVLLEPGSVLLQGFDVARKELLIFADLAVDVVAGFGDEMAVVEEFDGLLETDGDEQAEDDGGDVDEEVASGVGCFVGRVDVEHRVVPDRWVRGPVA